MPDSEAARYERIRADHSRILQYQKEHARTLGRIEQATRAINETLVHLASSLVRNPTPVHASPLARAVVDTEPHEIVPVERERRRDKRGYLLGGGAVGGATLLAALKMLIDAFAQ